MGIFKYFHIIDTIVNSIGLFECNEFLEYLLSGTISLITNLGIKGLIEAYVDEFIQPFVSNWSKLPDNIFAHKNEGESSSTGAGSSQQGESSSTGGKKGSIITLEDYQWSSDDDSYVPPSPDSPSDKDLSDDEILRRAEVTEANKYLNATVSDFKKEIQKDDDKTHIKTIALKIEDVMNQYKKDNVPAAQSEIPKLTEKLDICNDRITNLETEDNLISQNKQDKGKGKA
jgi:polyhydroxyalkanoate synthesis regulator phasin